MTSLLGKVGLCQKMEVYAGNLTNWEIVSRVVVQGHDSGIDNNRRKRCPCKMKKWRGLDFQRYFSASFFVVWSSNFFSGNL